MNHRPRGGQAGEGPATDESDLIIEFHRIGNSVKVTAVDPATLLEVSIVGDPALGERALARAAARKLRYVLQKRADGASDRPAGRPGRGGKLV